MHDIITKEEARKQKLIRYFSGEPCVSGHVDERYVSNGVCLTCHRERGRIYNKGRPVSDAQRAAQKVNNQTEHRKAYMRAYMKQYRQRDIVE